MKPWIIWSAALAGVLISLTLRVLVYGSEEQVPSPVVRHADVTTSNWDKRVTWVTALTEQVTVVPEPDELERIGQERPLLFLQTFRGDRVVVGAYWVEAEGLRLSDIRDLAPVEYVKLVAVYGDRVETVTPIQVDLRAQK